MVRFLLTLLAGLLVAATPALAGPDTGKQAIQIVAKARGEGYLGSILHVFGEQGVPQPGVWRVIARDARGAVREFYVSRGGIISEGIIPPANAFGISATPLPMHRLNIDSSVAFQKAEAEAKAAKIGFDSINYQLRTLELSTNAAWFLVLVDTRGRKVGEVSVGASTGTVLTKKWYYTPVPLAVPPQPQYTPVQDGSSGWDKTKDGIGRATDGVKRGLQRATDWVRDKVAPKPQPYYPR